MRRLLGFLALLVCAGALAAPAEAQRGTSSKWVRVGELSVDLTQTSARTTIDAKGNYKAVRFVVRSGAVLVTRVAVTYDGGMVRTSTRRMALRTGQTSPAVGALPSARGLSSVALTIDPRATASTGLRTARIEVQGLLTTEAPKAAPPAPVASGAEPDKEPAARPGSRKKKAAKRSRGFASAPDRSEPKAAAPEPKPPAEQAERESDSRERQAEQRRIIEERLRVQREELERRYAEERRRAAEQQSMERSRAGSARPSPSIERKGYSTEAPQRRSFEYRSAKPSAPAGPGAPMPMSPPPPIIAAPAPQPVPAPAARAPAAEPPPPPVIAAPAPERAPSTADETTVQQGPTVSGRAAVKPPSKTVELPPPVPPATTDRAAVPPPEPGKQYATVPVYFGTDRQQGETRKAKWGGEVATFGVESAYDLTLGKAVVTVPTGDKVRERGEIPRPELTVFGFRIPWGTEDVEKHFTIYSARTLSAEEFAAEIRNHLAKSQRFQKQAFLFVHGFNVTFEDSLFRTAQIAHDLEFDGLSFIYSWPSQGTVRAYVQDSDRARGARDYLFKYMKLIAQESGAEKLHVIAHSMGADALVEVMRDIANLPADARPNLKINEMILAAPDIDRSNFEQIASHIMGIPARGITLYASNNDKALYWSRKLREGRPRVGDVPSFGPVMARGMETIDISNANTDFFSLNHSTFADRYQLISDMRQLIEAGVRPPDRRSSAMFIPVETDRGIYWKYKQPAPGVTGTVGRP